MYKILISISLSLFLLAGCSGKSGAPASSTSSTAPKQQSMAPADQDTASMGPAPSKLAHGVIDQTQNEKEFKLRRSLWGVQTLIDDYKKHGYDTSRLETRKAELQQQLQDLLG